MRRRTRWLVVCALAAAVGGIFGAPRHGTSSLAAGPEPPANERGSVLLASGELRRAVEWLQGNSAGAIAGGMRVEVAHDLDVATAHKVVTAHGGVVEGEIEGLIQAVVPINQLVALETEPGIRYLRAPLNVSIPIDSPVAVQDKDGSVAGSPITGEEVQKTNADDWNAAGFTGSGVKIGIVDSFDGDLWSAAQAAGEVPAPAGTFCQFIGLSCTVLTFDTGSLGAEHGVAVAEIIHEMAPDAQIYLARVQTTIDLQDAQTYFSSQGVDIISRSLTSEYDGPGDGTGPISTVINNAVADGMTWFNSAGNAASDGSFSGQYWRRVWTDSDGDGWMEFAPGDELLGFDCGFVNGIRWSDFGETVPTDYDIYVFDTPSSPLSFYGSENYQGSGGFDPIEMVDFSPFCSIGEVDYLGIKLFAAGDSTAGDILEFMANGGGFEYWQNPYSASGPVSDTASSGALSIGAIDPANGTTIAPYSSQGPTNDDRKKPDISVASCVNSFTLSPDCFSGTSAAAPAAAGAAALLIDAGVASSPAAIKTYLLNNAVDRGAAGLDNVFGAGELILPAPPGGSSTPTAAPPSGSPTPTRTPSPSTGIDLSIGVGSQCDSAAGPTTCAFNPGESFTLDFKLNALGANLISAGYAGYDVDITYSGNVTYNTGSLQQTGAGVWPGCVFATGEAAFTPGENYTACSIGAGALRSTYMGVIAKMGFTCGASGTGAITLVHGNGRTDLVDGSFVSYSEAADESLTISCGTPPPSTPSYTPTDTHSPSYTPSPTNAPTPTETPRPPTPTPQGLRGDVTCNLSVDSIDAAIILQYGAGLIGSLVCPQNGDVNRDGRTNALDAQLVLQYVAGLIGSLPAGASSG